MIFMLKMSINLRLAVQILSTIALCSVSFSQAPLNVTKYEANPPLSEISSFLDRLDKLKPEYKADLGLTLLENEWTAIPTKKRVEELNKIYESASSARYEASFLYAGKNAGRSSASQLAITLQALQGDTLDIETRAIHLFLRDMPARAASRFAGIALPNERSTCSDPLVKDLSSYYRTLGLLMRDGRIVNIASQDKRLFLIGAAQAARTPEQLAPLIIELNNISLNQDDLRAIASALTLAFNQSEISDREMSVLSGRIASGLSEFLSRLKTSGVSELPLVAAYRKFLVETLSREACADSTTDRPAIIASFNNLLSDSSSGQRLEIRNIQPKVTAGSAIDPLIPLNESLFPQVRRILDAVHARDSEVSPSAAAGKGQPESADVHDVLQYAVNPIPGNSGCHLCDFYSRSQLFAFLNNTLAPGQFLETAIASELRFLSYNGMEDEEPPAFLGTLKLLLHLARPVSAEAHRALAATAKDTFVNGLRPTEDPDFFKKELHSSSDPVISTYAIYEDLFRPEYTPNP